MLKRAAAEIDWDSELRTIDRESLSGLYGRCILQGIRPDKNKIFKRIMSLIINGKPDDASVLFKVFYPLPDLAIMVNRIKQGNRTLIQEIINPDNTERGLHQRVITIKVFLWAFTLGLTPSSIYHAPADLSVEYLHTLLAEVEAELAQPLIKFARE